MKVVPNFCLTVIGDRRPEIVVPLDSTLPPGLVETFIDARKGPPFTFRFFWREMPSDMVAMSIYVDFNPVPVGSMLMPTLAFKAFRDVWGGGKVDSICTTEGGNVNVRWEQMYVEPHDLFRYFKEDQGGRYEAAPTDPA